MKKLSFYPIKIEEHDEGGFLVSCPTIQGAWAEGDNVNEAILNLQDVVVKILEYRKEDFPPFSIVRLRQKIKVPNLALAVKV